MAKYAIACYNVDESDLQLDFIEAGSPLEGVKAWYRLNARLASGADNDQERSEEQLVVEIMLSDFDTLESILDHFEALDYPTIIKEIV